MRCRIAAYEVESEPDFFVPARERRRTIKPAADVAAWRCLAGVVSAKRGRCTWPQSVADGTLARVAWSVFSFYPDPQQVGYGTMYLWEWLDPYGAALNGATICRGYWPKRWPYPSAMASAARRLD